MTNALAPRTVAAGDLRLRPLTKADETAVTVAMGDADILRWAAGRAITEAPESDRGRMWLAPRIDCWATGAAVFAITDLSTDKLLGSVSVREVNRLPDQAVITYWVTSGGRGRGVASTALSAAARWALTPEAEDGLGLHRLSLDHALANQGSCRVAIKAGFHLEGTMRDFYVDTGGHRHHSHLHARLATDPPDKERRVGRSPGRAGGDRR